ncbi:hypothetical protein [Xanthomonas phage NEB7]|nr:hypothetical protein [Xanthomonas phage NEB7]
MSDHIHDDRAAIVLPFQTLEALRRILDFAKTLPPRGIVNAGLLAFRYLDPKL